MKRRDLQPGDTLLDINGDFLKIFITQKGKLIFSGISGWGSIPDLDQEFINIYENAPQTIKIYRPKSNIYFCRYPENKDLKGFDLIWEYQNQS